MSRKAWIVTLGLLLGLLASCSSEPEVVEVTREVEVIQEVEVEVEADPFPTPLINLTPVPGGDRLGEGAGQMMAEDEQSTGQEDQARPTPFVPRDKQPESAANPADDLRVVQQNTTAVTAIDSADSTPSEQLTAAQSPVPTTPSIDPAPPRSEDAPTATPIVTSAATSLPTTQQIAATPSPTARPQPADLTHGLSHWVLMTCGTFR